MKAKTKYFHLLEIILICILLQTLMGCKKEVIPISNANEIARINFFDASEVFNAIGRDNYIYINDSVPSDNFRNGFPKFRRMDRNDPHGRTFPGSGYMHPNITINVHNANSNLYHNVYWFPMQQGEYKFIFSTDEKVFAKDTTLKFDPKQYYAVYLLDDPNNDGAFNVLSFPEDIKVTEGKVRLRVIHLSPDLGGVRIIRNDVEGKVKKENFPEVLNYRDVTDYIEIDTTGASKSHGNILLGLTDAKNPDHMHKMQIIPADPGSTYVLLIKGHQNQTQRKLIQKDGTYRLIRIIPNIRTLLRRLN